MFIAVLPVTSKQLVPAGFSSNGCRRTLRFSTRLVVDSLEQLWNHTKYAELANVIPDDPDDLYQLVHFTIESNRHNFPLLRSFLKYTQLTL